MPTAHNEAKLGDIAKYVIMPGDPLRAEFIANTYLDDVVQFNNVRGMKGFTGTYNGKRVSVMGSGMGMPSMGIYSYELFNDYGVERIVRVGSCGSAFPEYDVYTVILSEESYSDSSYIEMMSGTPQKFVMPSKELNDEIKAAAKKLNIDIKTGRTSSGDVFYKESVEKMLETIKEHHIIGNEMEATALFHNAKVLGKKAACILTVSDNFATQKETTSIERQNAFTQMMEIALEIA